MARVILDNVSKTFPGEICAVRELTLEVADGEFVVLLGPSGCGKSTTLRLIAGLEEMTSGTITMGDRVVNRLAPKDRDVAMVFQNAALYPHLTAFGNMAFGLAHRRVPRGEIERRVKQAAEILGITDLLTRRPGALAGGERQRVALGRAFVREPACFLFDEPLSNLDITLRVQMRAELKSLHQRLRTTTIHVTHDQEEAMTLGDRVAVMAQGRLQQMAPPLEVYRRPANRFVAGFVGLPPMNFVEGAIVEDAGGLRFRDESGEVGVPVPSARCPCMRRWMNERIVAGIRPEGLEVVKPTPGEASVIHAHIVAIEPLGNQTDVVVETATGIRLVTRVDAEVGCEVRESISLRPRPEAVHFFEAGPFGLRIHAPSSEDVSESVDASASP